jgi:23S rRNA pseudouridine2605 synthase
VGRPKPRAGAEGSPDVELPIEENAGPVRLQKLLAAAGLGSRRGAEEYLRQGRVTVNGVVAKLGDSAHPRRDVVAVDGERLEREAVAYWIVHKPAGMVTTVRDPQGRRTIMELLPRSVPQVHPVGRLDYESTGLVLLTNDGGLTHALLHPSLGNEREYQVTVRGELDDRPRRALEHGVVLEEGRTAPAKVGRVVFDPTSKTSTFSLTLVEGRNRQIRRSLLTLGCPVKKLVRVRMGPLRLGSLPRGEARCLRPEEIQELRSHALKLAARRSTRAGRRPRIARTPNSKR